MKEEEIRPKELFYELLRLARRDCRRFFRKAEFFRMRCPGCSDGKAIFAFKKNGFSYELCSKCSTLFVNPRPRPEVFNLYYREGESIKFLSEHLYKKTERARRKFVQAPKIKLVKNVIGRFYPKHKHVGLADIGAGYGTFCGEFLRKIRRKINVYGIEPSGSMAKACRNKGIEVINKPFESVRAEDFNRRDRKVFTCFELVEHLADPDKFFAVCRKVLNPGEILVFTTLNSLGFDIQLLWDKSKSLLPPYHLNFFNPYSVEVLMKRHGFRIAEITTPGRLDIDIIDNSIRLLKEKRFWSYFLKNLGPAGQDQLQKLLQKSKLSSHMAVVAQRKGK